jgi:type I restriction enzyme S subunit
MMTPYTTYKPSGIEWIGDIPEHWEVKKIKNSFKLIMGQSPDSGDCNLNGEGIPFLQGNADFGYLFPKPQNWCIKPTKIAPVNSVLLSVRAPIGAVNIADQEYCIGRGLCSLVALNTKFLYFCLDCLNEELNSLGTGSTFKAVSTEQINNTFTVIPPLYEQTAIATYLDRKTAEIDRIIANKQKLIALYEEEKQTIINQAVTRGVDKTVKLKPSGVEWLGDIPEHWGVKKLGYMGRCQNGISIGGDSFGSGYPFVSYGDVYKNDCLPISVKGLVNSTEKDRVAYSVDEGDVFFTRTSETSEEIGIASVCKSTIQNATFAGFLIRFRPYPNLLISAYSKYYFRSQLHRYYFVKEMNIVTRASLSQGLLRNLVVLLPPLDEQSEIANYLDNESSRLDTLIVKFKKQIELFQEYRTTLISEVVTGKMKV